MTDLYRQTLLVQHLRSPLPPLLESEESPPAVPPKDPEYRPVMDFGVPQPASGSKRKRGVQDDTIYDLRDGRLEVADLDFTPTKKARSNAGTSDGYASNDETPVTRSVRRKKGAHNLSRLNLRHATSTSSVRQRQLSPTRESKFQEGSLNDKPSEKPASFYTRFTRTDSGNLEHVDQLMTDYHDGMPTPTDSTKAALEYEKASMPQRVEEIHARQRKEEGGMFRFGKSIAAAFHPVSLWNRLWSEQKDELSRHGHNPIDADQKIKLKEEVEARYAQMKATGQFSFQTVSVQTPHDSAIALTGLTSDQERVRTSSFGSMLHQSQEESLSRDVSEVPESAPRPTLRGIRSRLHLRKPSLQNLKDGITGGLKRVASDMNLAGVADRESSPSVSPVKPEFGSVLRQSQSRQDLKRQKRLSKRVSDLESKLNKARLDLDEALVAASPMPKLGSQYERFTPSVTIRRPKFVPGTLATLPSEGVLFPKNGGDQGGDQVPRKSVLSRPRRALDLSQAFDDIDDDEEDEEETVKALRDRPYPTTAKGLFSLLQPIDNERQRTNELDKGDTPAKPDSIELVAPMQTPVVDQDNASDLAPTEGSSPIRQPPDGLDSIQTEDTGKAVRVNNSSAKSRKRSGTTKDMLFRPGAEDDDDAEWDEAVQQPKKKRKSTVKAELSQQTKRSAAALKTESPASKNAKNAAVDKSAPQQAATSRKQKVVADTAAGTDVEGESEDELNKVTLARISVVSNPDSLDPVYEEEEEATITVPLKDVPSKPTAKATPARFGRNAGRGRSNSPHKRDEKMEIVEEEKMMTRAAEAAQQRRGSRSSSPHVGQQTDEAVAIVPGDSVPELPSAAIGRVEVSRKEKRATAKENFEWPDDVF